MALAGRGLTAEGATTAAPEAADNGAPKVDVAAVVPTASQPGSVVLANG
jgi:hypothetical protein